MTVADAYRRMVDVREQIVAAARGTAGPVDPLLWEYLAAAQLEMLLASAMGHIAQVESIDRARKDRQ